MNALKFSLIATTTMLLAGCSIVPGTDANHVARVETLMRKVASDPDAVQFQNEKVVADGICGEMNVKNAFGAYTGFTSFYASDAGPVSFNVPFLSGSNDEERRAIGQANIRVLNKCPYLPSKL